MSDFFLPCVRMNIKPTSREAKIKTRKSFNYHAKQAFRDAHPAPNCYEIHHILPISLGGENDWLNLCLIEPWLHRQVHIYIDKQVRAGHKQIMIPRLNGTVWHNPNETMLGFQMRRAYG